MEMFKKDHRRPVYVNERNDFRPRRLVSPSVSQPQRRFESHHAPYREEIPSGPIRRGQRILMPEFHEEESNPHVDSFPSYQSSESDSGPRPLLSCRTLNKPPYNFSMISGRIFPYERHERRQENRFRCEAKDQYNKRFEEKNRDKCDNRFDVQCEGQCETEFEDQYEEEYNVTSYGPVQGSISIGNEEVDVNGFLQQDEAAKRTIDDIIAVAQTLREKLVQNHDSTDNCEPVYFEANRKSILNERRSIRPSNIESQQSTITTNLNNIPRLMDLKPKIPSLLDLQISPPFLHFQKDFSTNNRFIKPRDLCSNCKKFGHKYEDCRFLKK